jgi:hypothetical protein
MTGTLSWMGQNGAMMLRRLIAFGGVLGLVGLALLCALSARVAAQAAAPEALSAVDVGTSWLFALKRGDTRILDRTSVYPFELHIQNAPCRCGDGKARDAAQLAQVLAELMKCEDVKGLEVTSSDAKEISKEALPKWAKRWTKNLPKAARLVQIETSGGLVHTLTFVLVITGNQVRSAWLNAATDGGA